MVTIGSGGNVSRVKPHMISPRVAEPVSVPDLESEPPQKFHLIALMRIERQLQAIARRIASSVRVVDEYSIVGAYLGDSDTSVEVQPEYDTMPELITAVLVTGPVSTTFTLQLGNRNWNLATTANGFCLISPIGILLTRNDRRILTSATAGNWTLELTGRADERF